MHKSNKNKRIRLFDDESPEILHVHIEIPYRVCNYRCNYCYLPGWNKDIPQYLLQNLKKILVRIKQIKRPLHIIFLTDGEITFAPSLWPYLKEVSKLDNLRFVTLFSNLSNSFESLFQIIPPQKMSIIAAYHIHQFKNKDKQKEIFFKRIENLSKEVRYIVGNFVLSPNQIKYFKEFKKILNQIGVKPYPYPQISKYTCTTDFKAYTKQELIEVKKNLKNDPNAPDIINDFLFGKRINSLKCAAGRDHIRIREDGETTRCFQLQKESYPFLSKVNEIKFDIKDIEHLGNIFDPKGPLINTDYELCPTGGCPSNWPVAFSDKVTQSYKRINSLFNFVPRKPEDIGSHSFELEDHLQ